MARTRGAGARKRRTHRRTIEKVGVSGGVSKALEQTSPDGQPVIDRAAFLAATGLTHLANVSSRRREVRNSLVASGAIELTTTYEMTMGSPAERFFIEQYSAAGYTELRHDHWPCEITQLAGDEGLAFRVTNNERVYRLADGTFAFVRLGYGMLHVSTAGPSVEACEDVCFSLREAYPASYLTNEADSRVPITFWSYGQFGPVPRLRKVESASWGDIERNYTADVVEKLSDLMSWSEPQADGQLLLWQGSPGTGKTWALRALASEWSKWAEFHYITDPDAFFVDSPSYMVDVLLSDSYMAIEPQSGDIFEETDPQSKWRILILEDTGELLGANAKEKYGQGLSRLLNVVDGMIGQGLRVMALVTTNDELGDLHPAVSRPGRCAMQIEFGALTAEEASTWLGETVDEGGTVAELYARVHGGMEALAPMPSCENCDHGYTEHLGTEGPCTIDGCSCNGYMGSASADAEEFAASECAVCNHAMSIHEDGSGPCMEPGCSCAGFEAASLAAAAGDVALPVEMQPGAVVPPMRSGPAAPVSDMPLASDGPIEWSAVFCPEGRLTDDGRAFAPGAIQWRQLPLTLMAMIETSEGGHIGAELCGRIDRIWRDDAAGLIRAAGIFDTGEYGAEIARLVDDRTLRGVSVDLAIHEYEVGPKSDWFDEEGNWAPKEQAANEEEPNLLDILFSQEEDSIAVVTSATIGMTTVCPFPAFADAEIAVGESLVAGGNPGIWTVTMQGAFSLAIGKPEPLVASSAAPAVALSSRDLFPDDQSLTAAAAGLAPVAPPAEWFDDPELEEVTGLTVDEEGRIFGHAAVWGTCHTAYADQCRTAPHSEHDYAYFHLGEILCEQGERVACGQITLDTGHADNSLGRADATRHYDDTGCAVADVVVGEDEFGIWVAGAIRPGLAADVLRELRGAKLSGDWRGVNGNLELIALLCVNVPGFPVPRSRALVAGGETVTLVASGIPILETDFSEEDRERFAELQRLAERAAV